MSAPTLIENLSGDITLDVQVLSNITDTKKYRLRGFLNGNSKILLSSTQLEKLVNLLVQSRIDDFIHQLDSRNITLAELYRMNKRL